MSSELWTKCMLEGDELNQVTWRLLSEDIGSLYGGTTITELPDLEKLITDNQIFLDPPHDEHVTGGPNAGNWKYNVWTATVSSRCRGYTNKHGIKNCVGRGAGETPRIAILRAIVASFGDPK